MENNILNIVNLNTEVEGKDILKGFNLKINKGEVHVIMGPNGAGKSTLANTLMANSRYTVKSGDIEFEGENINNLKTHERAKKGLFLSFQTSRRSFGITVENFLKTVKSSEATGMMGFMKFSADLNKYMDELKMDKSYAKRYLNVGFSGGEKKKNEILQMLMINPKLAILDETDSGLE